MVDFRKLLILKELHATKAQWIDDVLHNSMSILNEDPRLMYSVWCNMMSDMLAAKMVYCPSLGEYCITRRGLEYLDKGKKEAWGLAQAICSEQVDLGEVTF